METSSLITDDVKQKLGKEIIEPVTLEIEKGAIRKFCQAIGDPNPLWQDETYAKKSRFGGIVAPPVFIAQLLFWGEKIQQKMAEIKSPAKRILAGGSDFEYYQVVRPGDLITATAKLADAYERETKTGKMLFLNFEVTYTNQKGEAVAIERSTTIRY